MAKQLPPLPPLKPERDDAEARQAVREQQVERLVESSVVPIPTDDAEGEVKFKCAACGKLHAWKGHLWGNWDSGQTTMVSVRKSDGRYIRFSVPIRIRGRVGALCTGLLKDFKRTTEPPVTKRPDRKERESA